MKYIRAIWSQDVRRSQCLRCHLPRQMLLYWTTCWPWNCRKAKVCKSVKLLYFFLSFVVIIVLHLSLVFVIYLCRSIMWLVAWWLGHRTIDREVASLTPCHFAPGNNSGQVVHTHVPLSPSNITWYWPRGSDVVRLGRWPQAWRKVMAAYGRGHDYVTCGLTA